MGEREWGDAVSKARLWREGWDPGAPWATEIPPQWNPGLAYSIPGDPESEHVGVYGFTTWETFAEAVEAVAEALSSLDPRTPKPRNNWRER